MKNRGFDPLAYIEKGFLDTNPRHPTAPDIEEGADLNLPQIKDYIEGGVKNGSAAGQKTRFRKTEMSAPRPRKTRRHPHAKVAMPKDLQKLLDALPKHLEFLCGYFDDAVTANYYGGEFKESREELVRRILDPQLTLEETSRLLGVCPATVRRYTNRKWLRHHRTEGGQRRFKLSDVVHFVEEHGRLPEV